MPKWKMTYDAGRKYNKVREISYPWLKCAGDNRSEYCVMCKVNVISKLSDISAHEKTKNIKKIRDVEAAIFQTLPLPLTKNEKTTVDNFFFTFVAL